MPAADSMVVMGQVMVPFGIRGWIKIRPFTAAAEALLDYPVWWLRPPGSATWNEVRRIDGRLHSDTVLAQLAGVESREAALALRGAEIGVRRDSLPEADGSEIYRLDLIGLDVVNREGVVLGEVAEVQDFGAQPILRVVLIGGDGLRVERLIPYVPLYVERVDLAARRIDVDWHADY